MTALLGFELAAATPASPSTVQPATSSVRNGREVVTMPAARLVLFMSFSFPELADSVAIAAPNLHGAIT
jgi:hypothetical protein